MTASAHAPCSNASACLAPDGDGHAAAPTIHHDQHVQERTVVELAELPAPLIGGSVQQPVGELRGLHGWLRDPVRAYPGAGVGSERGVPGERRQIGHGRAR
jgi:hypothetical protein